MRRSGTVPNRGRGRSQPSEYRQHAIPTRGGRRRGAGRKPTGPVPLVSHAARPLLARRFPVHVTMKLRAGLPNLRHGASRERVFRSLDAASERNGMRLVQFSVQSNHLHLLVEARDEVGLARGVQGLAVRLARGLNKVWDRIGRVFADRYHARILRTPREVRHALVYVLHNARKHGVGVVGIDPCSSGANFDGWLDATANQERRLPGRRPGTWLLALGWRRHGRIRVDEVPGSKRGAPP